MSRTRGPHSHTQTPSSSLHLPRFLTASYRVGAVKHGSSGVLVTHTCRRSTSTQTFGLPVHALSLIHTHSAPPATHHSSLFLSTLFLSLSLSLSLCVCV